MRGNFFFTALVLLMTAAMSSAAVSVIDYGIFASGADGKIRGWDTVGGDRMTVTGIDGGIEISVQSAGRAFNDTGFTLVKTPVAKGSYRITVTIGGDAGAKLFIGPRIAATPPAKDTIGPDIWETVGAAEKNISARYTVLDDTTLRIIIGVGMKENAGKKIAIRNLSFEAFTPEAPKTEVKAGAGTEYDNIIITNDVDDGSKPARLPVTVSIDESIVLRAGGKRCLGFVLGAFPIDGYFMNEQRTEISAEMRNVLATIPAPLNRIIMYVGSADPQSFRWKYAVGPMESRTAAKFTAWDKPLTAACGPAELIGAVRGGYAPARFIWTLNMRNDTPEDAADLAEFLTGDGSSPRGATNWAKLRIDGGAKQPVDIVTFELGNEEEWVSGSNRMSISDYVDRCRKMIAAVRSVYPKATFAPHAATAPWGYSRFKGEDWRDWHRTLLRELGNDISYLAFHPYYYGYPTSVIETYFDVIRDDVKNITGSDRIKLYISEHGLWPAQKQGERWEKTWYTTHALMGCLATAQFINRLYARDDIGLATYHCFNAGPWGLVYRGKQTKALYTTGIVDMFRLYNDAMGANVLSSTVTGDWTDPAKDDVSCTVTATDSKDGINLIIVNREKITKRDAVFSFKGRYDLIRSVTLTAPSVHSYNDENEKRIMVKDDAPVMADFSAYTVPEKSIVALYLKRRQ
ncbi:MAG: hypothetical protein HZC28_03045 [Spirochaetes bacterium]|nr:hypothetical protein [Spirochaetota bacterium]